jgi:hypothetical protein
MKIVLRPVAEFSGQFRGELLCAARQPVFGNYHGDFAHKTISFGCFFLMPALTQLKKKIIRKKGTFCLFVGNGPWVISNMSRVKDVMMILSNHMALKFKDRVC